jgi:hypothetical protein
MKLSFRSIIVAVAAVLALAFGFSQIAEYAGIASAVALYVAINFALAPRVSYSLGLTAVELAKLNAQDDIAGLIEENQSVAPELNLIPAFSIKGTSFTTLLRKTYPSGSFKKRGAGAAIGTTTFEPALVQCFAYENPLRETVDISKAYRRGEAAFLALTASGAVKGAMELMGKSLYYGARSFGGGVDAHPGLIDMYDATNLVVDAGGSTADTGSSVWFLKFGNAEDGNVSYVFGNDRVIGLGEWFKQLCEISSGKHAMCNVNALAADIGVQLTNVKAACRIKKLTEDSGKGMTDALAYSALAKMPANMKPDVALMTRRSVGQLRVSRAAVTGVPADNVSWPTTVAGVRIVETDSILNTEALSL